MKNKIAKILVVVGALSLVVWSELLSPATMDGLGWREAGAALGLTGLVLSALHMLSKGQE